MRSLLPRFDIHQRSIDSAKLIFGKLGFEDFICEFIKTDAAVYRNKCGTKFHIIITETMQKTLEKEPQAAITLNLADQLRDHGVFIPQKITVKACLANIAKEFDSDCKEKERIPLGTILDLSADTTDISAPHAVRIPYEDTTGMRLMLLTNITVFGDKMLDDYDSGISYPTILNELEIKNGQNLEFRYVIDENPHFAYQYIG